MSNKPESQAVSNVVTAPIVVKRKRNVVTRKKSKKIGTEIDKKFQIIDGKKKGATGRNRKKSKNIRLTTNVKTNVRDMLEKMKLDRADTLRKLEERYSSLKLLNDSLVEREDYHQRADNIKELHDLSAKIEGLQKDKDFEVFVRTVKPLLASREVRPLHILQRQVIFEHLFKCEGAVPCFIEQEICPSCHVEFVVQMPENMSICPKCGDSKHLIQTLEATESKDTKVSTYERAPLYLKYLMQFHIDAKDPPAEVIEIVHSNLCKIHILLPTKVKPTPVSQILREAKLQRWTPFAVRISKILNNEPIVKLNTETINSLIYRFKKVAHLFTESKIKNRKKIMNFEFLTKQFLLMEGLPLLADHFSSHKTRAVLIEADRRLQKCSNRLSRSDPLNWKTTSSC